MVRMLAAMGDNTATSHDRECAHHEYKYQYQITITPVSFYKQFTLHCLGTASILDYTIWVGAILSLNVIRRQG